MIQPLSLQLSAGHAAAIRHAAAVAYPHECCGLLIGTGDADIVVTGVVPTANTAEDPVRGFAIDPQAQFDLLRAMRGTQQRVVGHYHSHPDGPAAPSQRDRAMAHDPEAVWIVVAAGGSGAGVLAAFVHPPDAAGFRQIAVTETP